MELETIRIVKGEGVNAIIGQAHFIKTVDDLHDAILEIAPEARFGVAFCEASGDRLVRRQGTDRDLTMLAARNAQTIGAGHCFVVLLGNIFPISVLNAIKDVPEVCRIFCASSNVLDVIVAVTSRGRCILGVIDGEPPRGIESDSEATERVELVRRLGFRR